MSTTRSALPQMLGCGDDECRDFGLSDYEGARARWCPGCGDHSILTAVEKLLVAEQLRPEQTVFVSGIGCSSRFPHYLKTYGFHGIHGRALPIATGIKLQRPDLDVFVVMGDGDCCSIGAAHWIHAIRYNMPMTVLLLDNGIYGLTKKQTSPTTRLGTTTNTHPSGSILPPLNPLTTALGTTNVSFIAQTAEWIPAHLYATLRAARQHTGFAFVRILQRCPVYLPGSYDDVLRDPKRVEMLVHEDGVLAPELEKIYTRRLPHDPTDLAAAQRLAAATDVIRLGVFFRDAARPRYDSLCRPAPRSLSERLELLHAELDKYAV